MRSAAFISAIMAGYGAISLGTLKLLWRFLDVHFYSSGAAHDPQASLGLDLTLIAVLFGGGLLLVTLRSIIPALLTVLAVCLFEAVFLHAGSHQFWQLCVILGVVAGLVFSLCFNLLNALDAEKKVQRNETW